MSPIQIVLTVFFGFLVLRVLVITRRGRIRWPGALLWVAVWTVGLLAVWFPEVTTRMARVIGVGRGADAILYLSIALLSYLVFRLYVLLDRQEQALTRLVSELALRSAAESQEAGPAS
jgi:small membrane protein